MDWTPAVEAAVAAHDAACETKDDGHDWRYCLATQPVPEMARALGFIKPTLADRAAQDASTNPATPRPDLDATFCVCGHKRRGHSVMGDRCFASPCACTHEGGWREVGKPETWVQRRSAMTLNPDATGQAFSGVTERPDWFRHGD